MSVSSYPQECLFKPTISSAPVPGDYSSFEYRTQWCAGIIILVSTVIETSNVIFWMMSSRCVLILYIYFIIYNSVNTT